MPTLDPRGKERWHGLSRCTLAGPRHRRLVSCARLVPSLAVRWCGLASSTKFSFGALVKSAFIAKAFGAPRQSLRLRRHAAVKSVEFVQCGPRFCSVSMIPALITVCFGFMVCYSVRNCWFRSSRARCFSCDTLGSWAHSLSGQPVQFFSSPFTPQRQPGNTNLAHSRAVTCQIAFSRTFRFVANLSLGSSPCDAVVMWFPRLVGARENVVVCTHTFVPSL